MASHQLAIAKASFSAGLLRPDPTSVSREGIANFHILLHAAIHQCTPRNVQKCKQWILKNIAQSTARFAALGKYFTALATSFAESKKREPSIKRKRLHILYLLNDILYHTKYQVSDASVCSKAQPILVNLFGSAASFRDCPKHQRKLGDLLSLWEDKGYYSREYIDKLRETVKHASEAGEHSQVESSTNNGQTSTLKLTKSAPYIMPAMHGDPSTPWFDLPAGNLLQHIEPNSTKPINPDMIRPMRFVAGPADEELVRAVKALLADVDTIYGNESQEEGKADPDIDELGQPIILDEITREVIDGEGYYGWSRTFCEKMKRKKKGLPEPGRRDRSRSSSRGRKRRYSDSEGSGSEGYRRQRRRSYSSSRSRSLTPVQYRNRYSRPRSRPRSYSRSRSPRRDPFPIPQSAPRDGPKPPMPIPPPFHQGFNPAFPPPPPPFNGAAPPFGQWPPPPPPPGPPPMPYGQPPQHPQWPVPPPPPGPPPPQSYHQQPPSQNYHRPPQNYQHQAPSQGYHQSAQNYQQPPYPPPGNNTWQHPRPPPPPSNSGRGYQNNNNNTWTPRGGRGSGNGNYRGRGNNNNNSNYRGRGW